MTVVNETIEPVPNPIQSDGLSGLCTLDELVIAYRKTKVDLFYSPRPCQKEISAFEADLMANLQNVRDRILGERPYPLSDRDGGEQKPDRLWTLIPKKFTLNPSGPVDEDGEDSGGEDADQEEDAPSAVNRQNARPNGLIISDPWERWDRRLESVEDEPQSAPRAEFRLMEALPISFHVFATLWIQKVGHKFDEKLSTAARGNRLRRTQAGELNPLSLGTNTPYIHAYRSWRDGGISAAKTALEQGKNVACITADVTAFFHQLDPRFLLSEAFQTLIDIQLTPEERELHELFISALVSWADTTPLPKGLPVGLAASTLVANMALFELDRIVEREVVPLYYGRYVDDLILVMEDTSGFRSFDDVWDWIIRRSNGNLSRDEDGSGFRFTPMYLSESTVQFSNDKNKVFLLKGPSGEAMLTSLIQEMNDRTSEWRALPSLPSRARDIDSTLATAVQADGERTDRLSRTSELSIRRSNLALKIRDIEAYHRVLPPAAWREKRRGFLKSFTNNVLTVPKVFDFFTYIQRVVSIAVSCADFDELHGMIVALEKVLRGAAQCRTSISTLEDDDEEERDEHLLEFRRCLGEHISSAVESAFPLHVGRTSRGLWNRLFNSNTDNANPNHLIGNRDIEQLQAIRLNYFSRDLATRPFKHLLLPPEVSGGANLRTSVRAGRLATVECATTRLPPVIVRACEILRRIGALPPVETGPTDESEDVSVQMEAGILFPTRPPSLSELYLIHPTPFRSEAAAEIADCLLGLRGFRPDPLPTQDNNGLLRIPFGDESRKKLHIAVASWKTDRPSWVASVVQDPGPDPDSTRIGRLFDLLNDVIKSRTQIDYLVMPELSIPARWFLPIAKKLNEKGISLICGIEYLHVQSLNDARADLRTAAARPVRHQVWATFQMDRLGFPATVVYRQDKQRPAYGEEAGMRSVGNRVLVPQVAWITPPIIDHGGFRFSVLVCSELSNIRYRADLRGEIDALFVPEWNRDTGGFSSLVESSALDLHAYIIQCNDRTYGDSRIRAPYSDAWKRDIVRVRGGMEDFFVIGEIDIHALRQFQSAHRALNGPFKPVPDGFEISERRRVLPNR